MGKLSALIVFFNVDGGIMFKIFVGRDEKRELKADQLAKFRSLGGQLCGS
jgi:putative heme iron utilization protein